MNTILTDDELPPLQPQDHPEPHSFAWTEQEMRAIRARDRLVEAAVLAKLRDQEPVAWIYWHPINDTFDGPDTIRKKATSTFTDDTRIAMQRDGWVFEPLYAAPLPAVVREPRDDDYIGGLEYRGNSVAYIHQKLTAYRTVIDEAWQAMRDAGRGPDGKTPLPDAIRAALAAPEAPAQRLQSNPIFQQAVEFTANRAPEAPAQGDPMDMPLPCDVKIGNGTHKKGTSLRTLVLRAQKLHEAAFGPAPTKEEAAANLERLRSVVTAPAQGPVPAPWREAVKVMRWRPIKTAPRDGTNILLRWGSDGVSQGHYIPGIPRPWKFIDTNNGLTWLINHSIDGPGGPSHWMPMPPAAIALADSLEGGE